MQSGSLWIFVGGLAAAITLAPSIASADGFLYCRAVKAKTATEAYTTAIAFANPNDTVAISIDKIFVYDGGGKRLFETVASISAVPLGSPVFRLADQAAIPWATPNDALLVIVKWSFAGAKPGSTLTPLDAVGVTTVADSTQLVHARSAHDCKPVQH